jgi:hypothetical protein
MPDKVDKVDENSTKFYKVTMFMRLTLGDIADIAIKEHFQNW